MRRTITLLLLPLLLSLPARASEIADATGRVVQVPDHVAGVLPAGAPAAVLLEALAPDLMLGWPTPLAPEKRLMLSGAVASLPVAPHIAAHADTTAAVKAMNPDLIVDYGTVSPDYVALARTTQERTGVATVLLDGSLSRMPQVLRVLGAALHRVERGETLARLAEALLAVPPPPGPPRRVVYVRGTDSFKLAAPDTGATEIFTRLGWKVLATPGQGWFHPGTLADIATLDPDVLIFGDPAMRGIVAASPDWRALRAVHEGHAYTAPNLPFGWIEEPPSLNQLLGTAWLAGRDPVTLAATFSAVVYGHVMTADELQRVADTTRPLAP